VTSFPVGSNFLRVCMTTFPSFYFSGKEWRKLRKLLYAAFSSRTLDFSFDVFESNSKILLHTLKKKVGASEFDVCPCVNLYTLDCIIGEHIKYHLRKFPV
jgi:cytochrome P450